MPTTDRLQYHVHKLSNTYVNKIRAKIISNGKVLYHIKEESLNILNELPELPPMLDIGPDVILADGQQ